jgi:predicted Rossmann-fold nucleotide-binding protein|tara:strand:+ start:563 stop:745 length:183 start_codon:yes stop_codon:yes gene_type:complete
MKENLPIIEVIGSGKEPYFHLGEPLEKWIAKNDYHLINGGGAGSMETFSKAFSQVSGRKA